MYEIKNFTGTTKDVDINTRTVTGYFADFTTIDSDNEIFRKGAFRKTIKERGPDGSNQIFHLFMHDIYKALGKPHVLKETPEGLYFETKIPDTTYGLDVLKLYAADVYNEHSVGFKTLKSVELDDDIKELTEAMLYEGSTVVWGANANTPFTGFKFTSVPVKEKILEKISNLQGAIKSGTFTDETFTLLKIELTQLETLLSPKAQEPDYAKEFANCFPNLN